MSNMSKKREYAHGFVFAFHLLVISIEFINTDGPTNLGSPRRCPCYPGTLVELSLSISFSNADPGASLGVPIQHLQHPNNASEIYARLESRSSKLPNHLQLCVCLLRSLKAASTLPCGSLNRLPSNSTKKMY
jgi:hypothetical protein